jgi:hypothetical protein
MVTDRALADGARTDSLKDDTVYLASFFPRSSPFSNSQTKNRLDRKRLSQRIDTLNKENYEVLKEKVGPVLVLIHEMKQHPGGDQELLIYWQLGEFVSAERKTHRDSQAYLEYMMETLANDSGISEQELLAMARLYECHRVAATLSLQLTWAHYKILLSIEDDLQRQFYKSLAEENRWSPHELETAVKENLYGEKQK